MSVLNSISNYFNNQNIGIFLTRRKFIFYIILLIGILLLLTPLKLLSYLILVLAAAAIHPLYRRSGYITRVFLFFLFITCLHQVIGLLFWKLDLQYTYTWSVLPLYAVLAAISLHRFKFGRVAGFGCTRQEIIAAMLSLFSVSVIGIGTFTGGSLLQQSIRYISRGFDNSTHLSIIMSDYKQQGYVYGNGTQGKIPPGFSGYPQGWHLSNSILWRGIPTEFGNANISKLMFTYVMTTLLWYSILLFLTIILIIDLAQQLLKKPLSPIEYVAVSGTVVVLQLIVTLGLLASGFSNYIALLTYAIGSLILLSEFVKGRIREPNYILLVSLLTAGMALTWLLAAPIGYVLVSAPFLRRGSRFQDIITFIKGNKRKSLATVILLCIGLVQCIIQVKYGSGVGHINASGGSWPINQYMLLGLFGALISVILSKKLTPSVVQFTKIAFISTAPLVGLIYIYQYHATATTSYYSEKMTLSFILVLLVVFSAIFTYTITPMTKGSSKILGLLTLFSFFLVLPVVLRLDTSVTRYAFGHRELSLYSASQIAEILGAQKGFQNNVIILKGLDQLEDVSTTHALDTLSEDPIPDKCRSALDSALLTWDSNQRIRAISFCSKLHQDRTYYIITSSKTQGAVVAEFAQTHNVRIIPSN